MKYYAVKKGREIGIFTDWKIVQPIIKGFKGAEYKSFKTKNEAQEYFEGRENTLDFEITKKTLLAYVDGSYIKGNEKYGSGVVFLDNDRNMIDTLSFAGAESEYLASNNVAGEICATIEAVTYAVKNNFEQLVVYYDYEGIEKWANGSWAANKAISKDYLEKIKSLKSKVKIHFVKVAAHTGDEFNEMADQLAKLAILEKSHTENKDGSITLRNIPLDEVELVNEAIKDSLTDKFSLDIKENNNMISYSYENLSEHLRANYFRKKCTLHIQGKPSNLMYLVMSYFVQLLPNAEEVISVMNDFQEDNVSYSVVESTFQQLLPNYRMDEAELNNSLYQAIQNYETSIEQQDYTYLVFPAFRALEYFLHKTLKKAGLVTTSRNGSNIFSFFEEDKKIQKAHINKFTEAQRNYVEELYDFYSTRRHKYFHWTDDILDLAIIEDINKARIEIKDACVIIDKYYTIYN